MKRPIFAPPAVLLTSVFLLLLMLCTSGARAQQVESETCLSCHDGREKTLHFGPHRLAFEIENPSIKIECVSCHTGGAVHIENPSPETIGNPANLPANETIAICSACHQPHTENGTVGFDPHIGLDLACTSCHVVHEGEEKLLADRQGNFCETCHVAVVQQFRLVSNHPLTAGDVTCMSCHDFTGSNEPMYGHGHGGNADCYTCHPQQAGPHLYEHEGVSSFLPEGGGCIACHNPHGSNNDRLLNQPDERLCFQCHGIPPLHRTQHEGIGVQFACMDCHSAVHGSDNNRALLDPEMGTKIGGQAGSCFCHNVFE